MLDYFLVTNGNNVLNVANFYKIAVVVWKGKKAMDVIFVPEGFILNEEKTRLLKEILHGWAFENYKVFKEFTNSTESKFTELQFKCWTIDTFSENDTVAHVLVKAGLFPSVNQARKAGFNKEIPSGASFYTVGKIRMPIMIWNCVKPERLE